MRIAGFDERRNRRGLARQEGLHLQPVPERVAIEVVDDRDVLLLGVVDTGQTLERVDREPRVGLQQLGDRLDLAG